MATYNLRQGIPAAFLSGDILNYPYRLNSTNYGGTLILTLPKGTYRLEAWGCAGDGDAAMTSGGYAAGTLALAQSTALYLTAGGKGTNGGAKIGSVSGSGGASDIRILQNSLMNRALVAGGGGLTGKTVVKTTQGGGYQVETETSAGFGGGAAGTASGDTTYNGGGGTQTAGGSAGDGLGAATVTAAGFGNGGYAIKNGTLAGYPGGGGWYGGGAGGYRLQQIDEYTTLTSYYGGGGGSGFALSAATAGSTPSGYALGSDYYLTDTVNKTGHDSGDPITEPNGSSAAGHAGEGYVRITVIVGQLAAPTNLSVTEPTQGTAVVSWNAVTNATSYKVYNGSGPLLATVSSPSYTQTGITEDTVYTWKIAAASDDYADSPEATVNYHSKLKLATPTNLKASYTVSATTVTWNAVTGATAYAITRDGVSAGTVSAAKYTDSGGGAGTSHTYTVTATGSGRWDSGAASISTTNKPQLSNVTGLSAGQTVSSVSLSWTAAENATGYDVYRGSAKLGSTGGISYTDSGTQPGTSYTYKVISKASGYYNSSGASITVAVKPRIDTPNLIEAGQENGSVTLRWVLRNYGMTVNYVLKLDGSTVYSGTGTSYTDTGLTNGRTYSYTLTASVSSSDYYDSLPATLSVLMGREYGTTERQRDYLKALRKPFVKLCRLRFLYPNGTTAFALDNNPLNRRSGAFIASGSVSANMQNGQRTTATVTLANAGGEFETAVNKIWFGQEVALDEGLILSDGTDYYRQTGVFRIDNPTEKIDPETRTVSYRLVDKWAALDGTLGGNLEGTYEVPVGTNIFEPMAALLSEDRGNGLPVDGSAPVFTEYYNSRTQELPDGSTASLAVSPYTLTVSGDGGTIARVLLGLAAMVNAWIGYDNAGRLRVEPSQDDILDTEKPVLWRFSEDEAQLLGMSYTVKKEDVYNDYIVVGEKLDDYSQPGGRATNLDPRSDTNVNLIGRLTKRESASGYATATQCRDLAEWKLKRASVLQKAVSISCTQMMHIELNSLVEIARTDKTGSPIERHLIQGYTRPLASAGSMTINAVSVNDFPTATVTEWPEPASLSG